MPTSGPFLLVTLSGTITFPSAEHTVAHTTHQQLGHKATWQTDRNVIHRDGH